MKHNKVNKKYTDRQTVISWLFFFFLESSQPLRITSGLKTNFSPSLTYSAHKSLNINHKFSTAQLKCFTYKITTQSNTSHKKLLQHTSYFIVHTRQVHRQTDRQPSQVLTHKVIMHRQNVWHSKTKLTCTVWSFPDGCLSHKSGLGFGALCLYTRYLVRQNFLDQWKSTTEETWTNHILRWFWPCPLRMQSTSVHMWWFTQNTAKWLTPVQRPQYSEFREWQKTRLNRLIGVVYFC